ncbi:uncharacterized protein LOC141856530 [Brevipalpus obovatus]|uniref:uncharacterized protein LOC141856530 n=1 Tax=Brevipalpus obovatus TaxID=246614 RepID=UPI003D9ED4A0
MNIYLVFLSKVSINLLLLPTLIQAYPVNYFPPPSPPLGQPSLGTSFSHGGHNQANGQVYQGQQVASNYGQQQASIDQGSLNHMAGEQKAHEEAKHLSKGNREMGNVQQVVREGNERVLKHHWDKGSGFVKKWEWNRGAHFEKESEDAAKLHKAKLEKENHLVAGEKSRGQSGYHEHLNRDRLRAHQQQKHGNEYDARKNVQALEHQYGSNGMRNVDEQVSNNVPQYFTYPQTYRVEVPVNRREDKMSYYKRIHDRYSPKKSKKHFSRRKSRIAMKNENPLQPKQLYGFLNALFNRELWQFGNLFNSK